MRRLLGDFPCTTCLADALADELGGLKPVVYEAGLALVAVEVNCAVHEG